MVAALSAGRTCAAATERDADHHDRLRAVSAMLGHRCDQPAYRSLAGGRRLRARHRRWATRPRAGLDLTRNTAPNSMGFSNGLLALAGVETLAERCQQAAMTRGVCHNAVLGARSGFDRGFDPDDQLQRGRKRPDVFEVWRSGRSSSPAWLGGARTETFPRVHSKPRTPLHPPDSIGAISLPAPTASPSGVWRQQPDRWHPSRIRDRRTAPFERLRSRYAGEMPCMDNLRRDIAAVERHSRRSCVDGRPRRELRREHFFVHGHSAAPDLSQVPLIATRPAWG